jgi:hypothetical protein
MESIVAIILSGTALLGYKWVDPNKDMQRYFHRHARKKFYMLQLAYTVLLLSFAFNSRYVIMKALTVLKNKYL